MYLNVADRNIRFDLGVTKRDVEVIKVILKQKYCSLSQVADFAFEGQKSNACARLKKLQALGLVKQYKSLGINISIYTGSQLGFEYVNSIESGFVSKPVARVQLSQFSHDYLVTDVFLKLRATGRLKTWTSERELMISALTGKEVAEMFQTRRELMDALPDAVFKLDDGVGRALEVEITQKSKKRYEAKIERYLKQFESVEYPYQCALYLVKTSAMLKFLTDQTKSFGSRFSVKLLEDFFK